MTTAAEIHALLDRPYINVTIVRVDATTTFFQEHGWQAAVERAIRSAEDTFYAPAAKVFFHDTNERNAAGLEEHTVSSLKADLAAGNVPA